MPEPKPLPWTARLPTSNPQRWVEISVTETVDREVVVAEVTGTMGRRSVEFVASWPRSTEQGYLDVYAILRAELGLF